MGSNLEGDNILGLSERESPTVNPFKLDAITSLRYLF
jgi:hypothetical protein